MMKVNPNMPWPDVLLDKPVNLRNEIDYYTRPLCASQSQATVKHSAPSRIRSMDLASQREVALLAGVHRNFSAKVCNPSAKELLASGHVGLIIPDNLGACLVSIVGGRLVTPRLEVTRILADGRLRTRGSRGRGKGR